eukprot:CAMPEP_0174337986 /NCGR_PEP_ID=MMETSP0810-20121108/22782_1 /TAXON_ID=73025 ORGANISM="Eutreptiella gymnastica-like, Strain CCMP1594" /NCGR_SAMPLE_ID=MMETSP0810 /ASSEMBLY_ACC=CAM_ASM_000659 /LENGTH=43 /DNA_ID= /DNA_START= /DNA_END= /DNA_ORIENTATION=
MQSKSMRCIRPPKRKTACHIEDQGSNSAPVGFAMCVLCAYNSS